MENKPASLLVVPLKKVAYLARFPHLGVIDRCRAVESQTRVRCYVMYSAPAEPCFFLTQRGFINAILCSIASIVRWRSGLGRSVEM